MANLETDDVTEYFTGIFLRADVQSLLKDKFVVVIGDSVQRSIYKDIVLLLQRNVFQTDHALRSKGEMSIFGDDLLAGGVKDGMTNAASYKEVREYKTQHFQVRYYFLTRCWNEYIKMVIDELSAEDKLPDVILFNSCLWDINRYNPTTNVDDYKVNLVKLFDYFKKQFPVETLILWTGTLPIAESIKAGFLAPDSEYLQHTLRLQILAANFHVSQLTRKYGFDFIDLHYHFQRQIHRRARDGVHWDQTANRRMTNLIFTHISRSWGVALPRYKRPPKSKEQIQHAYDSGNSINQYSISEVLNPPPPNLLSLNIPLPEPAICDDDFVSSHQLPSSHSQLTQQLPKPKPRTWGLETDPAPEDIDFSSDDLFYRKSQPSHLPSQDYGMKKFHEKVEAPTENIDFASDDDYFGNRKTTVSAPRQPQSLHPPAALRPQKRPNFAPPQPIHQAPLHQRHGTYPMQQSSRSGPPVQQARSHHSMQQNQANMMYASRYSNDDFISSASTSNSNWDMDYRRPMQQFSAQEHRPRMGSEIYNDYEGKHRQRVQLLRQLNMMTSVLEEEMREEERLEQSNRIKQFLRTQHNPQFRRHSGHWPY